MVVDASGVLFYSVLSLSVSESDKEEKPHSTVIPKEVTPALCSLMSSYGSLSGSESEPEGEAPPRGHRGAGFALSPFPGDAAVASTHLSVSEERRIPHVL